MAPQQKTPRVDTTGIPELESDGGHDTDTPDALEEMGKGIINAFTVERDTSLADGAGAPGSTDVGGLGRDERDGVTPPRRQDRS